MLSNNEKQSRFKERMYKAGLKQIILWVKRIEKKRIAKMDRNEFLRRLRKLTAEWNDGELSDLYRLFINIADGKEVIRKKRK